MVDIALSLLQLADLTIYNSLGYLLVTLGILVSIRFAGFPDLTADGSFTLGAGGYTVAIKMGLPLPVAWGGAAIFGLLAGGATAFVNDRLKVGKIISGVLVMIVAMTIAPYITGKSSVGLLESAPVINLINNYDLHFSSEYLNRAVFLHPFFNLAFASFVMCIFGAAAIFFHSRIGTKLRYSGNAPSPGLISNTSRRRFHYLGLMLGNSLVALGGAIEVERNGGFNVGMGLGTLLIGLTVLVLGESLVKLKFRRDFLTVKESLIAIVLGTTVYSFCIQLLLSLGVVFVDIRLLTTLFFLLALAFASHHHPNSAKLF